MHITDALSLLALRQLHPGLTASADSNLAERLRSAGPRLTTALQHALHRAWQILEVVLAGDAFWDGCQVFLDAEACAQLKRQVLLLRTAALPGKTAGRADVLRQACGRELRALRKAGLLTPTGGTGERLAEHVRMVAASGDPARLLDDDYEVLRRLRDELRRVQAPTLATVLDPMEPREPPLLVIAGRWLLRREMLAQKELTELLPLDERPLTTADQRAALTVVTEVLSEHGRGLQEWLLEDTTPAPARAMSKSAAQQAQQGDSGSPTAAQATATASNSAAASAPGTPAATPPANGNPPPATEEQKPSRRQRLLAWAMVLGSLSIPLILLLLLLNQFAVREIQQFKGHEKPVTAVALSADGKRVVSGSLDGTLRVWDAETGTELRKLAGEAHEKHKEPVLSVVFAPEGRLVLAVSGDRISLWDVDTGKHVNGLFLQEAIAAQGYFLKGSAYAVLFEQQSKDCIIWKINAVATPGHFRKDPMSYRVLKFPGPEINVRSIAISPDGKRVAFGGYKGIHLWDWEKEVSPAPVLGLGASIAGLLGLPSGQGPFLAAASDLSPRRNSIVKLDGHTDVVRCLAFSPDGKRLLSGGADLTLRLWDLDNRRQLAVQKSHGSQVVSVAFAPDGKHVISGSSTTKALPGEPKEVVDRRPLRYWEITDPDPHSGEVFMHETQMFEIPWGAIRTLAFSPDGKQVLSGGEDLLVRLWQLPR